MMQPAATRPMRHWAQINEFSFIAGMRLLFWLGRVFGRWPFRTGFISGLAVVLDHQTLGSCGIA